MRVSAVILFLLVNISVLGAQSPTASCSNASVAGGYGFTLSGQNINLDVSFAISGRFEADGKGGLSGAATQSVAGNTGRTAFTAVYTVNKDCTGNAKLTFVGGEESSIDFVLVENGAELLMIVSDQGTLETGNAKRQIETGTAGEQPQWR